MPTDNCPRLMPQQTISACNAAYDRNSPITVHQNNPQRSLIGRKYSLLCVSHMSLRSGRWVTEMGHKPLTRRSKF